MSTRFESNLTEVLATLDAGYGRNIRAAAEEWKRSIVKVLRGPRSGRFYRVPGTNALYQASAPGEPPASRTGRLRTSIDTSATSNESVKVGTPVIYGLHLERGTSRMRPRQFIRPGFEQARGKIQEALSRPIR